MFFNDLLFFNMDLRSYMITIHLLTKYNCESFIINDIVIHIECHKQILEILFRLTNAYIICRPFNKLSYCNLQCPVCTWQEEMINNLTNLLQYSMFLGSLFQLRESRSKQDWPQGLSSYPQLHSIVTVSIIEKQRKKKCIGNFKF